MSGYLDLSPSTLDPIQGSELNTRILFSSDDLSTVPSIGEQWKTYIVFTSKETSLNDSYEIMGTIQSEGGDEVYLYIFDQPEDYAYSFSIKSLQPATVILINHFMDEDISTVQIEEEEEEEDDNNNPEKSERRPRLLFISIDDPNPAEEDQ